MTTERAIELLHRISDSQFDGIHGDERREALDMAVRALFSQQIVNDSQGLVNDCISRQAAIDAIFSEPLYESGMKKRDADAVVPAIYERIQSLPSVQPQACDDVISRDDAIMAVKTGALSAATTFGRTDEGATAYYETVKAIKALPSAQPETHDKRTETHACDLIDRQQALKEMWKALYEYEDKTEKQFQESKDLDVRDWIMNDRLWVQNGHNLCVNVLANLPPAQPERKKGKWIWWYEETFTEYATEYTPHCKCSECGKECAPTVATSSNFCCNCGADMRGESDG